MTHARAAGPPLLVVVVVFAQLVTGRGWRRSVVAVTQLTADHGWRRSIHLGADASASSFTFGNASKGVPDVRNNATELARWIDVAETLSGDARPKEALIQKQRTRLVELRLKEATSLAEDLLKDAGSHAQLKQKMETELKPKLEAMRPAGIDVSLLDALEAKVQELLASETAEIEARIEQPLVPSELRAELEKARKLGLPGSKIHALEDRNHQVHVGLTMSKLERATNTSDIDDLIFQARADGVEESRLQPHWSRLQQLRAKEYLESGDQEYVEALWEYSKSNASVSAVLPKVIDSYKMSRDKISSVGRGALQSAVDRLKWVEDAQLSKAPASLRAHVHKLKIQLRKMRQKLTKNRSI